MVWVLNLEVKKKKRWEVEKVRQLTKAKWAKIYYHKFKWVIRTYLHCHSAMEPELSSPLQFLRPLSIDTQTIQLQIGFVV